jgi:hypothetical protein
MADIRATWSQRLPGSTSSYDESSSGDAFQSRQPWLELLLEHFLESGHRLSRKHDEETLGVHGLPLLLHPLNEMTGYGCLFAAVHESERINSVVAQAVVCEAAKVGFVRAFVLDTAKSEAGDSALAQRSTR